MMIGKSLMKERLQLKVLRYKMDKEKKNIKQINIELDEKVSSGEYSNFVVVTHSQAEFVMDFTRILPGVPKAKVHSRIEERRKDGDEDFDSVGKVYDAYVLLKNMFPYFVIFNYAEENTDEFIKKEIYGQK